MVKEQEEKMGHRRHNFGPEPFQGKLVLIDAKFELTSITIVRKGCSFVGLVTFRQCNILWCCRVVWSGTCL